MSRLVAGLTSGSVIGEVTSNEETLECFKYDRRGVGLKESPFFFYLRKDMFSFSIT